MYWPASLSRCEQEYSRSMTCLVMELLSPSQIGPAMTRMSAASTLSKIAGHSSVAQPCWVISGHTPVAMSWSIARKPSTCTPCFSMTCVLRSTRPWVLLISGERFSVQLMNSAFRSSYLGSVIVRSWQLEKFGVLFDTQQCGTIRGEQVSHRLVELIAAGHLDSGGTAQPRKAGPVRIVETCATPGNPRRAAPC